MSVLVNKNTRVVIQGITGGAGSFLATQCIAYGTQIVAGCTPDRGGQQFEAKGPKGEAYKGVRQQFVKLGASRGDQVAVLSGVLPGDAIVTSGAFKLRNGSAVKVNNAIQPANNPAPKPEDN